MRNILITDIGSAAWNGTDPTNENDTGGLAVWSVPPEVHNACNPIIFRRTLYLHRADLYEPPFAVKPNYITIDNSDVSIKFDYPIKSRLYLTLNTDEGVFDVVVYANSSDWFMSDKCSKILSVDRIGLSLDGKADSPVSDNSYIYLLPEMEYEDENYICAGKDKVLYKNTAVSTATLRITHDTESVTLSAESYSGIIKFDVSEVVKSWLADSLSQFPAGVNLVQDNALCCRYRTTDIGGVTMSFLAVNAGAQIGESSDRSGMGGSVLTRFSSFRHYNGYQLDYSILACSEDVDTVQGTAKAGGVWRVLVAGGVNLLNEDAENIQDEASRNIYMSKTFDRRIFSCCTPDRPFYIRWINMLGGVDYFMFAWQQKISPSVKSVSTYEPFVESPDNADSNIRPYALTAENSITVGADGLCDTDYRAISEMPFSPLIEWWSERLSRWVRLSVSKFDGSHYSKPETNSVEVTFTLPVINTQF